MKNLFFALLVVSAVTGSLMAQNSTESGCSTTYCGEAGCCAGYICQGGKCFRNA